MIDNEEANILKISDNSINLGVSGKIKATFKRRQLTNVTHSFKIVKKRKQRWKQQQQSKKTVQDYPRPAATSSAS